LAYRRKTYLMKYVVFMGTMNFLFHPSHGAERNLKVVWITSCTPSENCNFAKNGWKSKGFDCYWFTTRYTCISKCIGISEEASHTILRRDFIFEHLSYDRSYKVGFFFKSHLTITSGQSLKRLTTVIGDLRQSHVILFRSHDQFQSQRGFWACKQVASDLIRS
jgi:hypothetical protein